MYIWIFEVLYVVCCASIEAFLLCMFGRCEALCRVWSLSSLKGMSGSYIVVYIWLFEALCRAWGSSSLKGMSGSYLVVYIWLSKVFVEYRV